VLVKSLEERELSSSRIKQQKGEQQIAQTANRIIKMSRLKLILPS
jgi:hypothetical protein